MKVIREVEKSGGTRTTYTEMSATTHKFQKRSRAVIRRKAKPCVFTTNFENESNTTISSSGSKRKMISLY